MLAHGFADIQGADEIALVGRHRIVHRSLHRSHRSQMRHGLAAGHGACHQGSVGHIALDQLQTRIVQRQVGALASGQVVQHAHGVAPGKQRIGQVRANETGAAGDEDGGISHGGSNGPARLAMQRARRAA
ncbi:hypothetical protein D9M71_328040 [compost metagenome]